MDKRQNVAVLGATGMVGQKVIALLQRHAFLVAKELAASVGNEGKLYKEAVDWREPFVGLPEEIGELVLKGVLEVESKFVISCLPSEIAAEVEPMLSARGHIVFSNASVNRMRADVPLLVSEINFSHLELLNNQPTEGKIITNSNCATVFLALAMAPLMELSSIDMLNVVTMQSLSGAGSKGVASMDAMGNVIPYIENEAEKIQTETLKILGSAQEAMDFSIFAQVNRVPVLYGHMLVLHVTFGSDVLLENVLDKYRQWNEKFSDLFVLHKEKDRPQPRLDVEHDDLRVHIGQLRQDKANSIGMVVLGNNLVRGAAGAAIANIEAYLKWSKKD